MVLKTPQTPTGKRVEILEKEIEDLNYEFALGIPNPRWQSPSARPVTERSKEEQCRVWMKELFWKSPEAFGRALTGFRKQLRAEMRASKQWVHTPDQEHGVLPSSEDFLRTNRLRYHVSAQERLSRVDNLWRCLHSEMWIVRGGEAPLKDSQSPQRPRSFDTGPPPRAGEESSKREPLAVNTPQAKRKSSNDREVFHTAPSSPNLLFEGRSPSLGNLDGYDDSTWNETSLSTDTLKEADDLKVENQGPSSYKKRQSLITDHMLIAKSSRESRPATGKPPVSFLSRNTLSFGLDGSSTSPEISFATTVDSVFDHPDTPRNPATSFETNPTQPSDEASPRAESVEGVMLSEEFGSMLKSLETSVPTSFQHNQRYSSAEQEILEELLQTGPFSRTREHFSEKIPLRARYELERVRQHWKVEPKKIIVGDKPYAKYPDFWQWLAGVGQRMNKSLPEKPSVKAWNAANGCYEGDRHSEVVVFSGALDWCNKNESGIFKLRLNPLKFERTCRFHRRFGSDRFLSITMPSPSQPPSHLCLKDKSSLREILTKWLVDNDHHLLRRTWRAFYVDDVKTKRKSRNGEPRVRIDFFAVDGADFTLKFHPPTLSPVNESCESRTRMTVDQLVQWHMPLNENRDQTDCKLFNRIGLALSKTWATVVIQPDQFRKLRDVPGNPVMNDGCALMSRPLARAICAELGIDGITPSCFQGRIAGAKGLWMVDKDQGDDETSWIQISDSQLKIKPHPSDFFGVIDKEKITFEVASWSKPLRSSELNTQLLEVLNNRGQVKGHIAETARTAIRNAYAEFETVMEKNSIPLARALIQKIRPIPEDGYSRTNLRRVDGWLSQNTESVIRFLEAGFLPRDFSPLRDRLRRCLNDALNRYVNELHIPVPLSTYAYCVADPYGILEPDEVHFAFSGQWRDCPSFEDAMVDGMDVLVGRTPAHCPWDIQRRRAVWKSELRHFKDVIVFSTKGTTPLASLLSGGDYDGDRPWVCWDQGIVETFTNTIPPPAELGPEHFGLVKHARPMTSVSSVSDLLQGAFKFNLITSNLGRCTIEHEKLAYDESEGISSPVSLELAMLLSHLVDSKKSGYELTEDQWLRYRKSISPMERKTPAYKEIGAKMGKRDNINDYLRFEVANQEKEQALGSFSQRYDSEAADKRDEDLLSPWKTALARADGEKEDDLRKGNTTGSALYKALKDLETQINQAYNKWLDGCHPNQTSLALKIQLAVELLNRIQPPEINHPLAHTWQNSEYEWRVLLASGAYFLRWRSPFSLYAAGETLCSIKAGKEPSRLIRDQIYMTMKVNSSAARRLAGAEAEQLANDELEMSDDDSEEFDRVSVIDALRELDEQYQ